MDISDASQSVGVALTLALALFYSTGCQVDITNHTTKQS